MEARSAEIRGHLPRILRSLSLGLPKARPEGCVPSMNDSLEVKVLYPA